ncbi:hypothetical protein [Streptomyces antnestii]|uniref:hypothetical protein n=1 Tax=Streptomyces antnestii TaxID=2494256 RepID=UPI00294FF18C|nr:hypothetical protein [Streptomyces sp. San01]
MFLALAVDGHVQAEAEEFSLAAGDPVCQVGRILCGRHGVGVVQPSPVRSGAARGFQAGALLLELLRGERTGDGLDV